MPHIRTHPDPEELNAFGLGRLSEARSQQIELHLADCEACRQQLHNVPDDALIYLLQAPASETQANRSFVSADTDASLLSQESMSLCDVSAAPSAFAVPRELAAHPRYLVLAPLGAGGMGMVFKARHTLMERVVALKIVNPLLIKNPGALERFRREVRATAQLVHPNIVTAYDAETVEGTHFLVMEYVEGQTLAQVLAERHTLPINQACEYLRQTSLGLQHALQHGMVHRDVKPQNLMLAAVSPQSSVAKDSASTDEPQATFDGQIKILDFGLARFVSEQLRSDEITDCGTLMGSADYIAPEQVTDAHTADARADIYSMGCTLYYLLTGQVPFPAKTLLGKLEAHRDRQPRPLSQMLPDVPLELANIVARMMAKDPDQRYQSPAEVALALRPFALTSPRLTQPPLTQSAFPRSAQAPRPPGTKRYRIFALGMGLLLAAIGLWTLIALFRTAPSPDSPSLTAVVPNAQLPPQSEGDTAQNAGPVTPGPPRAPLGSPPPAAIAPFNAADAHAHQHAWADYLGTQVETTNSVGAKMILIPPGEFLMGSTDEQVEAALKVAEETNTMPIGINQMQTAERPQHRAVISKPFLLGATEVTIGQYKTFAAATAYKTLAEQEPTPKSTYENPGYYVTDDSPAAVLAWKDATAFCKWLSEQEKFTYRLPTEAEWEYAFRSGTTTQYSFGDDHAELRDYGWYGRNSGGQSRSVGKKLPNAFGLFDMHGNVREWCHDYWNSKYYQRASPIDPQGPKSGKERVIRGGSWNSSASYSRSAYRPGTSSVRSDNLGFRCVREW